MLLKEGDSLESKMILRAGNQELVFSDFEVSHFNKSFQPMSKGFVKIFLRRFISVETGIILLIYNHFSCGEISFMQDIKLAGVIKVFL